MSVAMQEAPSLSSSRQASTLRAARTSLARVTERGHVAVDIAFLAAFRVLFGAVMCVALARFWAKGWIDAQLSAPPFHFTYAAFSFVTPLPHGWLVALFALLALSALGIAAGYAYRASALLFLLGFTYLELIDRAYYLNHYYLVSCLALLLLLLPAGRAFSLDVRLGRVASLWHVPTWMLWALRAQVAVVYIYAGIAKLNADWLLEAQPLRIWLSARSHLPLVGSWLATPAAAYVASWTAALFDLSVVFFLLRPRTRPFAFAAVVIFHAATGALYSIGMFPVIMIASATLFFAPEWPRALPFFAEKRGPSPSPLAAESLTPRWVAALVCLHTTVQVGLPLYQHLTARDAAWRLEGFNFAWNVMAAEKVGSVELELHDRESGARWRVFPRAYLTGAQEQAMGQDPSMVHAFAVWLAEQLRVREHKDVAVYAHAFASLNGRPSQRLIDPAVDLALPSPAPYVLPLSPRHSPKK